MFRGGYAESEKQFCLAVAVPRDIEGLTIVETRRPSDNHDEEDGWDAPKVGNITQAFLIFDDVFVPNERVFMNGEFKYTGKIITTFTAIYRAAIGACVAGQGDIMIGAAINMARANGLSQRAFQDKLNQMAINNEITYGVGLGAMLRGKKQESGLFVPDSLLAHVNIKAVLGYCNNLNGGRSLGASTPIWICLQNIGIHLPRRIDYCWPSIYSTAECSASFLSGVSCLNWGGSGLFGP